MDKENQPVERLKRGLDSVKRAQKAEAGIGRHLHLGVTFALASLLFLYAGYRLDRWLGTLPIFTIFGTFLGGTGGFLYIYKELTTGGRKKSR